jgi:hypothetical protein
MGRPLEGRGSQKTCLNRGWCSRGYGPTNRSEDKKGESRIDAIGPGFFVPDLFDVDVLSGTSFLK